MLKKLKTNVTLLNTFSNLILQFLTLLSGFIIPKIILSNFGSEVNGLVSSLNQFLNYIGLIEGGITGVVMANLYKPLYEKNYKKVSSIVKTANSFYKKISFIFIIYSIILSIIYPLISNTNFSYAYVLSLTLIISIGLFVQYCFSLILKTILNADKKVYIVSLINSAMIVANIVLALLSVKIFPSIHFLKLVTSALYLLQPLIFNYFVNKYYKIDKNVKEDKKLLKSRWDGFAINIATFIHYSTDVALLTLFTNLTTVSIYSVHALVTTGLRSLVQSISQAVAPTIGHLYAKGDKEELKKKFYLYEYIIFLIVFILFSVAGLLITPFVALYTKNINDANYYQPVFAVLLVIAEAICLLKMAHIDLAYSANKFKDITKAGYIEALINIVVSLLLVKKYKLIGVAIGTIAGMLFRMIYQVNYSNKNLIKGSQFEFYKKIAIFIIFSIIGLLFCYNIIPAVEVTIFSWVWHGILYTIVFIFIYAILTVLFYKEKFKLLFKKYIK